jgi:tRNA(Ile)-lysidine synthase
MRLCQKAPKVCYVGVSAGVDSSVLLQMMAEAASVLGVEVTAVHFHHGMVEGQSEQNDFRDHALSVVHKHAKQLSLPFVCNKRVERFQRQRSEAQLRTARYSFFEGLRKQAETDFTLVLAHHLDDVLETQLLKLIRGSGPMAFAGSSFEQSTGNGLFSGQIIRPFVEESKSDLLRCAGDLKITYLQDPSNQEGDALRNWLRQSWLPALETRRPGSQKSLSRSFELLSQWVSDTSQQLSLPCLAAEEGLCREGFNNLPVRNRCHVLLHYLHEIGVYEVQKSHIEEAVKRLDNNQNDLSFSLAGCQFHTSKHWIKVTAPVVP